MRQTMQRIVALTLPSLLLACSDGATPAVTCQANEVDCGGLCIDTQVDIQHCGACTAACDPGKVCSAGLCTLYCHSGTENCGGSCIDTQRDRDHCGKCDASCASGELCSVGKCVTSCPGATAQCGDKCIDPLVNNAHCGAAAGGVCNSADANAADYQGVSCAAGEVCSAGKCATSCPGATAQCGDKCIDPLVNNAYCGAAAGGVCNSADANAADYQGVSCAPGEVCSAGKCATSCLASQVLCTGKCVDPLADNAHCGAAAGGACSSDDASSADYQGASCAPGEVCTAGKCATSCLGSQVQCGGKCIDPQTDPSFCGAKLDGACSSTDASSIDYQGKSCPAGQVCSSGACATSCLGSQVLCDGKCVDPQTDPDFCGAALGGKCSDPDVSSADYQGLDCLPGTVCSSGACAPSCPNGQILCGTSDNAACVDPRGDVTYCGATGDCQGSNAGATCGPTQACLAGECRNLEPQQLLQVVISGAGGTVTSSPGAIDCGATCTESYNKGTSVELTAIPASGAHFVGWSGDCSGSGGCTVEMTTDRRVIATFVSGLVCTLETNVSYCTPGSLPEINLGNIPVADCHKQCPTEMEKAGISSGCWVKAANLNCYCRAGVLNAGNGVHSGGTCS